MTVTTVLAALCVKLSAAVLFLALKGPKAQHIPRVINRQKYGGFVGRVRQLQPGQWGFPRNNNTVGRSQHEDGRYAVQLDHEIGAEDCGHGCIGRYEDGTWYHYYTNALPPHRQSESLIPTLHAQQVVDYMVT